MGGCFYVLAARALTASPRGNQSSNRANNNGTPVVLESPSAKVSKSVTQLALALNGKHKK